MLSFLSFRLFFCFPVFLLENYYGIGKTVLKSKFNIVTFSDAYKSMPFLLREYILKVQYFFASSSYVMFVATKLDIKAPVPVFFT